MQEMMGTQAINSVTKVKISTPLSALFWERYVHRRATIQNHQKCTQNDEIMLKQTRKLVT